MRGRKASGTISIEQQIEKAQEKVIRTKAAYEKAVDELQKLLDKRDAKRKDEGLPSSRVKRRMKRS